MTLPVETIPAGSARWISSHVEAVHNNKLKGRVGLFRSLDFKPC